MAQKESKLRERKALSVSLRTQVLTESGYRCAVPTCRTILALDLHHILEVEKAGGDNLSNLIALCPTCHALYHRGTISKDSIYAYKSMLVSLCGAYDFKSIDRLLFLDSLIDEVLVSGDGLLTFDNLIASGLVSFELRANNNNLIVVYGVKLTDKGKLMIAAWKEGDRDRLRLTLSSNVDGS